MNDYISRAAAIEALKEVNNPILVRFVICKAAIEKVPAADVAEVVHGEWLGTEYDGYADGNPVYVEFACSVCGHLIDTDEGDSFTRYCPNCGAKMDGGADG